MTKLGVGGGLKLQGGQGPYQRRSRHLISLHYSNFLHVATQLPCVSRGGGSLSSHLAYTKAAAGWPYPPPRASLVLRQEEGWGGGARGRPWHHRPRPSTSSFQTTFLLTVLKTRIKF